MKEVEVQDYSQQLSALEAEIMRVQESQADSEAQERDNQKLSLELEKEKGRVAGKSDGFVIMVSLDFSFKFVCM